MHDRQLVSQYFDLTRAICSIGLRIAVLEN